MCHNSSTRSSRENRAVGNDQSLKITNLKNHLQQKAKECLLARTRNIITEFVGKSANLTATTVWGSNPPLSATLILLGFFKIWWLVATSSGNKSTLV